jgi:hypothetical protein
LLGILLKTGDITKFSGLRGLEPRSEIGLSVFI